MPRVALLLTNFLPYSQAFVFEQLRRYRRYEADVFCWRRHCEEQFPFPRVHQARLSFVVTGRSSDFDHAFAARGFDLVHAHFGPCGAYARAFAARHHLPLLVTFHGYDVPLLMSLRRYLPLNLPYALRASRMLDELTLGLCASTELKQLLLQHGVPEAKLLVHRLGIDVERFRMTSHSTTPTVVMIGRFVEKKGFEYGLRAFARVLPKLQQARLILIGNGEREKELRAESRELGIAHAVSFVGPLSQAAVAERLSQAQVLLAPSVTAHDGNRESGLIVVKEASASGVVPIASRHGGIPESIDDGVTGFLTEERDVETLATKLHELLINHELRRRMAVAGRHKMEREFDNEQVVRDLEALYDTVSASGFAGRSSHPLET